MGGRKSGSVGYSFEAQPAPLKAEVSFGPSPWRPDRRLWRDALRARPKGAVRDPDFRAWLAGPLRRFLPFRRLVAAYGGFSASAVSVKMRLGVGYSPEALAQLPDVVRLDERNCFSHWLKTQEPLVIDPDRPPAFVAARELSLIRALALGAVALHGVIDPVAASGSYVVFSGLPSIADADLLKALDLVAPVVHALLLRTLQKPRSKLEQAGLTPRQMQIAQLAASGMDDKSIARELGISEHTVDYHLRTVFHRLNLRKRAELVRWARW